jgi:hypothetical protein
MTSSTFGELIVSVIYIELVELFFSLLKDVERCFGRGDLNRTLGASFGELNILLIGDDFPRFSYEDNEGIGEIAELSFNSLPTGLGATD